MAKNLLDLERGIRTCKHVAALLRTIALSKQDIIETDGLYLIANIADENASELNALFDELCAQLRTDNKQE